MPQTTSAADFYIKNLRETLSDYSGKFEEEVNVLPAIICLFVNLASKVKKSGEREIKNPKKRMKILAALGYVLSPRDVFPEERMKASGYIDDILVCFLVLRELISNESTKRKLVNEWSNLRAKKSWIKKQDIIQICEKGCGKIGENFDDETRREIEKFCGFISD